MRRLAGSVADRVAREFRLLDDEREGFDDESPFHEGDDIYNIREIAADLASDVKARPSEEGSLARSLDAFAQESVSLMAARPEAASLDAIARAIATNEKSDQPENYDSALGQIDQTTRGIADLKLR